MSLDKSRSLLRRAEELIPGGVNSPVRAFKGVEGDPVFISSASGAEVTDADGNTYIDYVLSWGPMILGHSSKVVLSEIENALSSGTSFGAPTEREVELAELLVEAVPSIEMVRMVNSGTEATMSAVRLARGFTGRDIIIKFNGCYHGHADSLLVSAGSGVATFGIPGSPGIPEEVSKQTLSLEFNDIELVKETFKAVGPDKIAAIIVEPVPGNMGLILPKEGFLEGLREVCDQSGALLIFDEVMSGFRVSFGGAQERFDVRPDLTTLGKVIGGGLPVGAFGGRKDVMSQLAPSGPVYQAGTLSGNPLAMAAGLSMLRELKKVEPFEEFERLGAIWKEGMQSVAHDVGIPFQANTCGSMLGFFFSDSPVNNYSDAKEADGKLFVSFFKKMFERGIYLAPSAFEAGFLSTAHTEEHIQKTIHAAKEVFKDLA